MCTLVRIDNAQLTFSKESVFPRKRSDKDGAEGWRKESTCALKTLSFCVRLGLTEVDFSQSTQCQHSEWANSSHGERETKMNAHGVFIVVIVTDEERIIIFFAKLNVKQFSHLNFVCAPHTRRASSCNHHPAIVLKFCVFDSLK